MSRAKAIDKFFGYGGFRLFVRLELFDVDPAAGMLTWPHWRLLGAYGGVGGRG